MARKRYSDEDVLKLLREIDVHLHDGLDVVSACRKAGISDKSYYYLEIALENYLKVEIRDRLFFIRSANGSNAFYEP